MAPPKVKVLLIEDDASLLFLYDIIVSRFTDYESVSYRGDFNAVTEPGNVDWESISIVLVDHQLAPGVLGNDILRWVEEHYPSIRRIMITGDEMIEVCESHADVLLKKAVHPDVLIESLKLPDHE